MPQLLRTPEVAIIRFPGSDWGQASCYYWNTLYGAENLQSTAQTREWLQVWHLLAGSRTHADAVNANSGPAYPLGSWCFHYPCAPTAVYDHLVGAGPLAGVSTFFLCGITVSEGTLDAVGARVRKGARCFTTPRLCLADIRQAAAKLEDFDSSKLFCGATHTHCGPSISYELTGPGQLYDISKETDVMTSQQYILLLYERVGAGIAAAWQSRKPAAMSWGLDNAVVGYNRRLSYADGSAIMGFDTARPDFSHVERYEDHAVEMLFFWDVDQKLTGMLLNIACPSQVGRKAINALWP